MISNLPNFKRLLCPNPSPLTGDGTNTYLFGRDEMIVVDPGPRLPAHLNAILEHTDDGNALSAILVTHSHLDHSPLARDIAERTCAPVYGFGPSSAGRSVIMEKLLGQSELGGGEGADPDFVPDIILADGDRVEIAGLDITAHHTPGHFGNHLCFGVNDTLFCGDHVMGWSSTLVSPPDGDLTDFMGSCDKLLTLDYARYLPGHGPAIEDPKMRVTWLIEHRLKREHEICRVLAKGATSIPDITAQVYTDIPEMAWPAAQRNVLAHLIDLWQKSEVEFEGNITPTTKFSLTSKNF